MPLINYIWVGRPRFNTTGQDIIGPMLMAQKLDLNSNTVKFLYPAKYREDYTNLLEKHGVELESIEDYLKRYSSDPLINRVKDIYERPDDGCVQTYITSKDALAFAITYTDGGYVLDTNIIPANNTDLRLPEPQDFTCPVVREESYDSQFGEEEVIMVYEAWAKAARAKNEDAKHLLKTYLNEWDKIQKYYSDKTSKHYYNECGEMLTSVLSDNEHLFSTWETNHNNESNFSTAIEELGLIKFYFNTHTFENKKRSATELIAETLNYCVENNTHAALFELMVKEVNADITGKDEDSWSLLHNITFNITCGENHQFLDLLIYSATH